MIKKQSETIVHTHKGIEVTVSIDYARNNVSLVDQTGVCKKWAFGDRSLEYMQGWLDIIEAMEMAVRYAKTQLEQYQREKEKANEKLMIKIHKNASKNG